MVKSRTEGEMYVYGVCVREWRVREWCACVRACGWMDHGGAGEVVGWRERGSAEKPQARGSTHTKPSLFAG